MASFFGGGYCPPNPDLPWSIQIESGVETEIGPRLKIVTVCRGKANGGSKYRSFVRLKYAHQLDRYETNFTCPPEHAYERHTRFVRRMYAATQMDLTKASIHEVLGLFAFVFPGLLLTHQSLTHRDVGWRFRLSDEADPSFYLIDQNGDPLTKAPFPVTHPYDEDAQALFDWLVTMGRHPREDT